MSAQPPSAAAPDAVISGSAGGATPGGPGHAGQQPQWPGLGLLRWVHPVGLAVLVAVLVVGGTADPRPALHGPGLAVLLGLLGVLAGGTGLLAYRRQRRLPVVLQALTLIVLIAGSATLMWVQPDGLGFLGGFIAASAAATRLPRRAGMFVAALALCALALAGIVGAHRPLTSVMVSELGALAFYRVGVSSRLLKERAERSATLAERQRLAREMHDVLAHSLSGLVVHLEGARLLVARNTADPTLAAIIDKAHHLAQAGLGEARQAIGMLRDEDLPGPERLCALAEQFESDTGISCTVVVSGTATELGPQTRLTLYRVAQEALTNVRKHARPSRVELCLAYLPDGVRLTVTDFAEHPPQRVPSGEPGSGYGVSGMRERAELLGGTLSAASTARGFRVALWVPL